MTINQFCPDAIAPKEAMPHSPEKNDVTSSDVTDIDDTQPLQNFLLGAGLGAFMSGLLLWYSMEFSHTALADIGVVRPIAVLLVTLMCGFLTMKFKGAFFNSLMTLIADLGT